MNTQMRRFFNSLAFKIGLIIILAEIVVLFISGIIYTARFSQAINQRLEAQLEVPAALMSAGLLNVSSLGDQEIMEPLVGEEYIEGMAISGDHKVFVALNSEYRGQDIAEIPGVEVSWFNFDEPQSQVVYAGDYVVSINPVPRAGEVGFPPYAYIKVGTAAVRAERAQITGQFVMGSIATVLLTSLIIILSFNRTILKRVTSLLEVVKRVEAGDLAARVEGKAGSDELGTLQTGLNSMVVRLEEMVGELEQYGNQLNDRVAERTHQLEVVAKLSGRLNAILDLEELLLELVNQVKESFDYYHAHVYILDEEDEELIMTAGAGEPGRQMKAKGHHIPLAAPTSLVARAARNNEIVWVDNVREAPDWLPNELLPDTYSEMAVPIVLEEQVVGVLDVQEDEIAGLDEGDASLLRSLANQVAVAVRNARLFQETQAALKEVEYLNRRLTKEAWGEFGAEVSTSGYRFRGEPHPQTSADSDAWLPSMKEAAHKRQLIQRSAPGNGGPSKAEMSVPLVLRGEVIGLLGLNKKGGRKWSEEEIAVVETMANQISLALENARLSMEQGKTIVKLQEVDRLKSDFLASMSHELRTPLNSIIGFADILLQGIDGPLSENAVTDITAIHNSGKHLLALINDILDHSKIEAGRMELACSALSISNVFTDVAASVSSLLIGKPVELIQKVESDLPPIWADSLRLNQIIINLVSNAIKFTDEGDVTMGAERQTEKRLHIYVADTGIGIPEDKFDAVFEHFRQVDSRDNRRYQGTGMGLAIARKLVELHGGEMWLESALEEGSIFHFTIPFVEIEEGVET